VARNGHSDEVLVRRLQEIELELYGVRSPISRYP
jgi:hypothetical protein